MASRYLAPGVRAIAFDAVGTLIHPAPPAALVYQQVGRRHGSILTVAAIADRFAAAFQREEALDREQGWRTDEAREATRWRRIVAEVLHDVADTDACFRELFDHFSRPTSWVSIPEATQTLEALSASGYRLILASNYDRRLYTVAAGLPALRFVDRVVISSEVGWRKPAGPFFDAVCRSASLPAERILFIGDDRKNDYEGALRAGLRAALLDGGPPVEDGVLRIRSVSDLSHVRSPDEGE